MQADYESYARDATTDEWVNAKDATRGVKYVCPCPGRCPVFLKKPSGDEGVRYVRPHFAHYPVRLDDGSTIPGTCRGGGESVKHREAKQMLRENRGQYSFITYKCPECYVSTIENCSDGIITLEVRSYDGKWRYDALYTANNGEKIALEVWNKHKTTTDKIEASRVSGVKVAEFKANDILEMKPGCVLENHSMNRSSCEQCKAKRNEQARERLEEQRLREKLAQETLLQYNMKAEEQRLNYLKNIQEESRKAPEIQKKQEVKEITKETKTVQEHPQEQDERQRRIAWRAEAMERVNKKTRDDCMDADVLALRKRLRSPAHLATYAAETQRFKHEQRVWLAEREAKRTRVAV